MVEVPRSSTPVDSIDLFRLNRGGAEKNLLIVNFVYDEITKKFCVFAPLRLKIFFYYNFHTWSVTALIITSIFSIFRDTEFIPDLSLVIDKSCS